MRNLQPEKLVIAAATIAVKLSDGLDMDDLCALIELVGLIKCNLDGIRFRRLTLDANLKKQPAPKCKTTFEQKK